MTSAKPRPLTRAELRNHPLPAVESGDKDEHGRILVVAGSGEVPGAAYLAALAAMRAGAGKLQIATAESAAVPLGLAMPEARVVGLTEDRAGGFARPAVGAIEDLAAGVDAIVAGPGMLDNKTCARLTAALCRSGIPLVLDAAMLHVLPARKRAARDAGQPMILLPHAGEMAALLKCDEGEVKQDPLGCGRACARVYDAYVLVKGATSHVVAPDGSAWLFKGGSPGLGISGSGDTLAGIVGGLLSRGADALASLLWGVLLHGEAGAALSKRIGPAGFLAREIPDEIPRLLAR